MMNKSSEYELELIKRIQKEADGLAIKELCHIYQPMINAVKRKYYLRLYDEQDWEQEAMIVCYKTAIDFSAKRGKFGSYFKRCLNNHAISILRKHFSVKRKINNNSVSWEKILYESSNMVQEPKTNEFILPTYVLYDEWLEQLSNLELAALLISLGKIDEHYVKNSLGVDIKAIKRARFRVLQKIHRSILE